MRRAVAGAEREQSAGASGKWVAHWKMVHIVRPVWERIGEDNQLGRKFPALTYTDADAEGLLSLEPAPRTVRGARDLLSVALQYGNAFGQGFQAAALKPADFFGNDDVLYLMEDMATGEIRPASSGNGCTRGPAWPRRAPRARTAPPTAPERASRSPPTSSNGCSPTNTRSCAGRATGTFTTSRRARPCRSPARSSTPASGPTSSHRGSSICSTST
jgi:hypothetical protein